MLCRFLLRPPDPVLSFKKRPIGYGYLDLITIDKHGFRSGYLIFGK